MADDAVKLEIQAALSDPRSVCTKLDLMRGARSQARGGVLVCCPSHQEKTPSCSVTVGNDGALRVKCFGCDFSGDVFDLVGKVFGCDAPGQFREQLTLAADLAGLGYLLDAPASEVAKLPKREPAYVPDERTYPVQSDVLRLWQSGTKLNADSDVCELLESRAINPQAVDAQDLARLIPEAASGLPGWAKYQGEPWTVTGHRLLLPVYDCTGSMRSVRAWRVTASDTPKRLPPGGHKATGLILANRDGVELLKGESGPGRILFVEGEPDWLTWSLQAAFPVFGVLSGAWTPEHAAKVPLGSEILIRTHNDKAGDKYADQIVDSLKGKCLQVRRLQG